MDALLNIWSLPVGTQSNYGSNVTMHAV